MDARTDSLQESSTDENGACFESSNKDDKNHKYHRRKKEPKRRKTPDVNYWEDFPIQVVDNLPYDINGEAVYLLTFDIASQMKSSSDGQSCQTWVSSSRKGFASVRRVSSCRGSYIRMKIAILKFCTKKAIKFISIRKMGNFLLNLWQQRS